MNCSICKGNFSGLNLLIAGNEEYFCWDCQAKVPANSHRIFRIPSDNLADLGEKFKKLARRATKLGMQPPVFREIRTERLVEKDRNDQIKKVTLLHLIVVDAGVTTIKVDGWEFRVAIQHTDEGNILRNVSDKPVPNEYRTVSQLCQHCNTERNRKDTFILFHEGKQEYKQIGRSCLRDFFGSDALMYAERAQYLAGLTEVAEDSENGSGGGRSLDMLEDYLAHVAQCIRVSGWMSRSRARAMDNVNMATANVAYNHMHPSKEIKKEDMLYTSVDPESAALAVEAIEWASNIGGEDVSEYLHNIRTVARNAVVDNKNDGLAASIVSSYQRHLNQLRSQEIRRRQAEISKHVGDVKEIRVFRLHVEKVNERESDYGMSYQHIMSDADGNAFIWYSSSIVLETGEDVILKGTIKAHSEFNNVKQTVLTRCTEVELHNFMTIVGGTVHKVEAIDEKKARKALRDQLGLKQLPIGTTFIKETPEAEVA